MAKVSVEILEGKSLSSDGGADPYCVIGIFGSSKSMKTKAVKNSPNPSWNEKFEFSDVDILNQEANTLHIEIRDDVSGKKDSLLGRSDVALEALRDGKVYHVWLKLKDSKGEVRVKLCVTRKRETSSSHEQLEKEIIDFCRKNNSKFEDKQFVADNFALYKTGTGPHTKVAQWKRPSEFCPDPKLFVDGVEAGDVIQGALGDCYFLGALSVVATRKDLLEPLIVSAHPEYGFYQIKFFKNGDWQVVTIDDRIPCANNVPMYSRCKDVNEIWVPLIEKAYAKLHRCYEALDSGSIAAALTDLTGEATQIYNFKDENVKKMISDGSLWEELKYFASESFLMGCSFNSDGPTETDNGMGILGNHAYGILDVKQPNSTKVNLMSIRNPWGRLEWNGRYADNASDWTPSLMKELNVTFSDDGAFWMCLEDFVKQYNQMIVLRLLTDDIGKQWQKKTFQGEFRGKSAGGSTNHPTWRNNPQYGLIVKEPNTRVFIALNQPDQRMNWTLEYAAPIGLHLVKTSNCQAVKTSLSSEEIVAKVNYLPARDTSISATLQPGEYILFPSTFNPGQEVSYWLTVYSEEPVDAFSIKPDVESGVKSEWRGGLAGGCFNHATWVNNPKFLITPQKQPDVPVRLVILLRQPDKKPLYYMGMYTGAWAGQAIDRNLCKGSKPCLNAREVSFECWVKPNEWPRFAIPHTFEANQESTFELYVQSSIALNIEHLNV
eukprot:TRINITY_DN1929_c0_g1_i1.p1 TRINITY_DN1929_c0_g1~~TRINITY_DN1929_c0_g1_i1.p1  ORF type:complete len:718 (-),score=206.71 TRINITY_DN1929_c0_g1_i1:60-2213(-)